MQDYGALACSLAERAVDTSGSVDFCLAHGNHSEASQYLRHVRAELKAGQRQDKTQAQVIAVPCYVEQNKSCSMLNRVLHLSLM